MKKIRLFAILTIALIGITLSVNIIGCKKDVPTEDETTMEDESADMDNAADSE